MIKDEETRSLIRKKGNRVLELYCKYYMEKKNEHLLQENQRESSNGPMKVQLSLEFVKSMPCHLRPKSPVKVLKERYRLAI